MSFSGFGSTVSPGGPITLVPYLKPDAIAPYSYLPSAFKTDLGRLNTPTNTHPRAPTIQMVNKVREGELIGAFRRGRIFRARDLIGSIDGKTANISLDETYNFQTRPLPFMPPIDEDGRSVQNLFYVAVDTQELPSYHFWLTEDDPDPTTATNTTDWNAVLNQSKPVGWPSIRQGGDKSNEQSDDETPQSAKSQAGPNAAQGDKGLRSFLNSYKGRLPSSQPSSPAMSSPRNPGSSPFGVSDFGTQSSNTDAVSRKLIAFSKEVSQNTASPSTLMPPPPKPGSSSMPPPEKPKSSAMPPPPLKKDSVTGDTSSRKASMVDVSAKPRGDEPGDGTALLRFERGGMYLKDLGAEALKDLSAYLVMNEEEETAVGSGQKFIDMLKPTSEEPIEYTILSGKAWTLEYHRTIKPFLGLKGWNYRIRSDAYDKTAAWDNSGEGTIKLTRDKIGYCYVNAVMGWDELSDREVRKMNSERFECALKFLFGRDDHPPSKVTLEIGPHPGAIDIDRSTPFSLSSDLAKILAEKAESPPIHNGPYEQVECTYSAEIFVHPTGDDFDYPLARAMKSIESPQKETHAETSRPTDQQPKSGTAGDPTQVQQTVQPGPSISPRVHTQSEIIELERRVDAAEARLREQPNGDVIEDLVRERDILQSQVQDLEGQVSNMEKENDELQTANQRAEDQINDLVTQRNGWRVRQRELEDDVQKAQQQRDNLQKEMKNLNGRYHKEIEGATAARLKLAQREIETEKLEDQRDQLQEKVNELEKKVAEETDDDRSLFGSPVPTPPSNRASAGPSSDPNPPAKQKSKSRSPQASAPNPPHEAEDPKKLLYCAVCLTSVDKLSENSRTKHAQHCETTVSSFQRFTVQEAKALRAERKAGGATSEAGPSDQKSRPELKRKRDHESDEAGEAPGKKLKRALKKQASEPPAAVRRSTRSKK